jgi:hypothetical protein
MEDRVMDSWFCTGRNTEKSLKELLAEKHAKHLASMYQDLGNTARSQAL